MRAKSGNTGEIWMYAPIGDPDYGEIGSMEFIEQLQGLGDVDSITLRINSPGGDVFEGVAIYNALLRHPAKIYVEVDALCASIASVIAMAGNTISIAETGMIMIHNPRALAAGTAEDVRKMADLLDQVSDGTMLPAYSRTRKTPDQIRAIMAAETWYTSKEAVAAGWADKISSNPSKSTQARAHFDLSAFRHAPAALCAANPETDAIRAAYQRRTELARLMEAS